MQFHIPCMDEERESDNRKANRDIVQQNVITLNTFHVWLSVVVVGENLVNSQSQVPFRCETLYVT